MNIKKILFLIIAINLMIFSGCMSNRVPAELCSPDQRVQVIFSLNENDTPVYSVHYDQKTIISESRLAIELKNSKLSAGLELTDIKRNESDEVYEPIIGKSKHARNHYKEMQISLRKKNMPDQKIDIFFRTYNDGVAFRYLIRDKKIENKIEISAELSEFNFTADHTCWALELPSFTTNYEKHFNKMTLGEIQPEDLIGLPLTIEINDSLFVALTEANLTNYAGMYLEKLEDRKFALESRLSPLPDSCGICVQGFSPLSSPWRVIMIGNTPGDLIESNIVINLNEPCEFDDVSWIKPGKVAWPWWSNRVVTGVDFQGGMNTATMKHYIDFASDYGLEYLLIDAKWYGPHKDPAQDITTKIPEIDMPDIIAYANERNVGIIVWLNWENTKDQMAKAFPLYEKWGIKGVKIDYMNRDDQRMVNFYHNVVKKAAEHHLLVDFHGAYKPTGFRRTYPNLITREGVLGLEHTKWSDHVTPEHNVTIPFTRMLAGPMDYTPGAFRNVSRDEFKAQYNAPTAMGTRCHHLAMYVVYESPLQMLSDYPGSYRGEQGADFLQEVPSNWDETVVIAGEIGDYIAIARRYENEWFIGAMTDWGKRTLKLPLDFLGTGKYDAKIYTDVKDAEKNPTNVLISKTKVTAKDKLVADLVSGGGYVVILMPVKEKK